MVVGHTVEATLKDGAKVKGEVVVVRDEALVMDVKKTSGEKAYPKGNGSIPRSSLVMINLERTKGAWGRTMGTVVGVLAGMVGGGYTALVGTNSAGSGTAVFLGIASAGAVGGYYAGRALDKHKTLIKIVP